MRLFKKMSLRQRIVCLLLSVIFFSSLFAVFYYQDDTRQFRRLSEAFFISELSGNTLGLHYTLAWPEECGLKAPARLPSYAPASENNTSPSYLAKKDMNEDTDDGSFPIIQTLKKLEQIHPDRLNESDAFTYNLFKRYLTLQLSGSSFSYYQEPLSPASGMQSGLPILLADYTFRSAKDVEDYLKLLDQTDTYFAGLIQYEKEKAASGLFMSDHAAEQIIEQCTHIMDKEALASETHFLHTTFRERLQELENSGTITHTQALKWISENDRLLTTVMAPAYEELADAFTILQGSGSNDMGLYYFPEGRSYYEYLLASTTGSNRSIPEIKQLLFTDFQTNCQLLLQLLKEHPQLTSATLFSSENALPSASPAQMLSDLQNHMSVDFPSFPAAADFSPACTIKQVSPSLEDYCSPAYYLIPPIDDITNNTIYINYKKSPDPLTLYTTLAHEGYPGHLYQTVYSHLYLAQQNASPIRYLLHFGGYTEGWALYVENLSYQYAAELAQENNPDGAIQCEISRLCRNMQICMYSLLDIAIHYDGATPVQAQKILSAAGVRNPQTCTAIYNYIVEEPANYLKYYLGFLEILSLKEEAKAQWGDDFTAMRFHQFLLENGPSDFCGLRERLKQ